MSGDPQNGQQAAHKASAQQPSGGTLPEPLLLLTQPDGLQLLFKLVLHKITSEALMNLREQSRTYDFLNTNLCQKVDIRRIMTLPVKTVQRHAEIGGLPEFIRREFDSFLR